MQGFILSGFKADTIEPYLLMIQHYAGERANVFFQAAQKDNPAVVEVESTGPMADVTKVTRYYQQWGDGQVILYARAKMLQIADPLQSDSSWIDPNSIAAFIDAHTKSVKQ